jgi:hypothetical protein
MPCMPSLLGSEPRQHLQEQLRRARDARCAQARRRPSSRRRETQIRRRPETDCARRARVIGQFAFGSPTHGIRDTPIDPEASGVESNHFKNFRLIHDGLARYAVVTIRGWLVSGVAVQLTQHRVTRHNDRDDRGPARVRSRCVCRPARAGPPAGGLAAGRRHTCPRTARQRTARLRPMVVRRGHGRGRWEPARRQATRPGARHVGSTSTHVPRRTESC